MLAHDQVPSRPDERASPSISVALATFNGQAFVKEQLASIAAQTVPPSEVIVSDDGSTDATVQEVRSFATRAPFRVRLLENRTTVGYSRNFQRALSACRGDYVFLCDQDDVWYPTKIATMVGALAASPESQLAVHDVRYCDANMTPMGQTKLERYRFVADPGRHYVTGMATVVRRALLDCALPVPDEIPAHDTWLHECARALDAKLVVSDVLADYRRHDDNATRSSTLNRAARTSSADLVRATFRVPSIASAEHARALFGAIASWSEERTSCLVERGLARTTQMDEVTRAYGSWSEAAHRRRTVLERHGAARALGVLRLFVRGDYSAFSGVRSAVKDLLQRP